MFERFTERSRRTMALANGEAVRFRNEYIGTEHILLALLVEGSGTGVAVLKTLVGDLDRVRVELERLIVPGPEPVPSGRRPQTEHAKRVIQDAITEARSLKRSHVGTEHLLLGLLWQADTMAFRVLTDFGVSLEGARAAVSNVVNDENDATYTTYADTDPQVEKLRSMLTGRVATVRGGLIEVQRSEAGAVITYTQVVRVEMGREGLASVAPEAVEQLLGSVADNLERAAAGLRRATT